MENPIIQLLKSNIGKTLKSPSNLGNWLNGILMEAEDGKIVAKYIIREEFTNPMGVLHGGMYALIMDELMGALVFTLGNEFFFSTINLSVDYLATAKKDEPIIVKAEVIKAGKNIIHCECKIFNEAGKLLAKSVSNLGKTHLPAK